jgi:glutamate N-acetyltransferase/amino-acid N-acetyltransferase
VEPAIDALSVEGGVAAATAIMTTDTVPKTASVTIEGFSVGGMAKGAGMLAPALATMLVVITTDAVVNADQADRALREACSMTFDRIDSDGCMSTNDTVLLLASGASRVTPDPALFADAVTEVCANLARQLIADAEGSSKDIEIDILGAASVDDALDVGRAVARSNLLKCAIHGEDPNWGRVLSAVGTTTAEFEPGAVDVAINGVWVCLSGSIGESRDGVDLSNRLVRITVNLHAGPERATLWTNDLTAEYVHENSAYAT